MPNLSDIVQFVTTRTSLKLPADRDRILYEINNVWEQMYYSADGPENRYTMAVQVAYDQNVRVLTLPEYVYAVRAVRALRGDYPVTLYSPEYFMGDTKSYQNFNEWIVQPHTPLLNNINNATQITFTAADVMTSDVLISISGTTDRAQSGSEIITLKAGQRTISTKYTYRDVTACSKNIITAFDIIGTDGDGTAILKLPNCWKEAKHVRIQFKDLRDTTAQPLTCFNILFERRCPYLFNDADDVPLPYDKALQNKVVANIYATIVNAEGTIDPRVSLFNETGTAALKQEIGDLVVGETKILSTRKSMYTIDYSGTF